MKKTPAEKKYLDIWTARITGADILSRDGLDMYTEGKLREVLQFTYEDSIFYREELGTCELFPGILRASGERVHGRLRETAADVVGGSESAGDAIFSA